MNALTLQTLRLLADGEFRSGEAMARALGVSRASVWNALHALDGQGIDVFKVRGRGYRLAAPLTLLERTAIEHHLGPRAADFCVQVLDSAASTNTLLLQRAADRASSGSVIVAECQTSGRGRRGREWHSALGAALTFSLLWRFQQGAASLAGLSLAIGIGVVRALALLGVRDARLKWPNDVLWRDAKLAGILIEIQGDMLGPSAAVIGIGLNCRLPDPLRARIDQPAADVATASGAVPDRNRALALVLVECERVLEQFAREGFAPLRDEWQSRHVHRGQVVRLSLPDGTAVEGTAEGVADDGALLLTTGNGRRRFHSGEVNAAAMPGKRGAVT